MRIEETAFHPLRRVIIGLQPHCRKGKFARGKIIKYTVGKTIDRYDFEKKAFIPDDEMLKIYFGAIEASIVSKDETYAAIEKFSKRFYS